MKLLPCENYILTTKLSPRQALEKLERNIQPKKNFPFTLFNYYTKPYEGSIYNDNRFEINRITGVRSSFLPLISGYVTRNLTETNILIKMRLSILTLIFIFIWLLGTAMTIMSTISKMISLKSFDPLIVFSFLILLLFYAIVLGSFKNESIKSKKFLTGLFEEE